MLKYFILTYGCQMNAADSERIAADLEKKKYTRALKMDEADFIVVNMCSVRKSAVDRVYGKLAKFKQIKKKNPKLTIALAGCVLKKELQKPKFKESFDFFLTNKNYLKNSPVCENDKKFSIPISFGCSNYCTYCVVPYTRGKLTCRKPEKITGEIKSAVKKGFKEIWLLGQNVNDYKSGKVNFAALIKMAANIPGDFSIFFMSSNPKDFSDELISVIAENRKISRWINIPLQSGDDKILKAMNRPYTAKQYENLIGKIKKKLPDVNISTDIIVGFPGETRAQFENTRKLANKLGFNIAFINKYSPRPGTAAFKLGDPVPFSEKERRWKILNKLINAKP